ncbi:hypothetical protein AUJ65_02320 [Candidatus Micrarchaeota archaeon CG1_02_51_15]|nr:MAG: hypothetical protein AUJ65_02320 [Candidatus Micrarchaeota archaeon CG1_02_51_15]
MGFDEFAAGFQEKWESFLESCDEKGIPLRGFCEGLEERGIPALPFFAAIVFILVLGALWFSVVGPVLMPTLTSTSLNVRVLNEAGEPISGAVVALRASGTQIDSQTADDNGRVSFASVPAGPVVIEASAGADYESKTDSFAVEAGKPKSTSLRLIKQVRLRVSLRIQVDGPAAANVSLWTENKQEFVETKFGSIVAFDVDANNNYVVLVQAPGYRDEEKLIQVGLANTMPMVIRLWKLGESASSNLHVIVRDSAEMEGKVIENASVEVRLNGTDAVLATLSTDGDGATEVVDVPTGSAFSVFAKADGFLSKTVGSLVAETGSNYVTVRLAKKTADNSKSVSISVVDSSGTFVESPSIALYCGVPFVKKDDATPFSGVTSFDVGEGESCVVTAFKDGFLAASRGVANQGEYTIALQNPTSLNSGKLSVAAVDSMGSPVPAAMVSLFYASGYPTGIPEQRSGLDGKTVFNRVANGKYEVRASYGNKFGYVNTDVTAGSEGSVQVTLLPLKATLNFEAVDYYSNAAIANALVSLTDSTSNSVNCTTDYAGRCALQAAEGKVSYVVSTGNYGSYSAETTVTGGASSNESVRLVSASVAASVKLVFLGVFDSNGKKVSALSPASVYSAKYLIRAPQAAFESAEAFVLLGQQQAITENDVAEIIDYYAPDASLVEGGADFSSAAYEEEEALASETPVPTPLSVEVLTDSKEIASSATGGVPVLPSTVGTSQSLNNEGYKWARFRFGYFNGSKELRVVFRTKAVASASVLLSHRSAFKTASGILRDPEDTIAGVSKPELLARTVQSGLFEVNFQGDCADGLCVQAFLEGVNGKSGELLEAIVPEELSLNVKLLSSTGTVALALSTEGNALQLIEARFGTTRVASRPSQEGVQELSLDRLASGSEAVFKVKAKTFAQDAILQLEATSGDGAIEKTFSVRVVNPRNNLKVVARPLALKALESNKVTFIVNDAFDQPVSGARIVLGSEDDELGLQLEATASENTEGTYFIDGVEPAKVGEAEYGITVEGFKTVRGTIPIVTQRIFSIEPNSLSVSASLEDNEPAELTLTNLLDNDARVSIQVMPDSTPQYTELVVDEPAFTLTAKQEKIVNLRALVSNAVLTVALKQNTLSERVNGRVHVIARLGETTQEADLRFSASTSITQQALAELVEFSDEELEFSINPPRESRKTSSVNITNNARHPVLINQQSSERNVRITPLSAQLAPGETKEFTVTASLPRESTSDRCIVNDVSQSVDLEFRIAMQSVSFTKVVKADVEIAASSRCYLSDGLSFTLPVPVIFKFPTGTVIRGQPADDGSIPVLLPSSDKIVFYEGTSLYGGNAALRSQNPSALDTYPYGNSPYYSSAATSSYYRDPSLYSPTASFEQSTAVNQQQAVVPAGVQFVMSSRFASSVTPQTPLAGSSSNVIIRFPTVVFLQLPSDAEQTQDAAGTRVNLRNAYIILPPNTPILQAPGMGVIVQIPPNTPVAFGRTGSELGSMELNYDEEMLLQLPTDARAYQAGGGIHADFTSCTRLTIRSVRGRTSNTLPAARSVDVQGATLEGTGRTAVIRIPPSSVSNIRLGTCLDSTNPDDQMFSMRTDRPTTIILPPGYDGPTRRFRVDFDSCQPIDVRGGMRTEISSVRRIVFPESSRGQAIEQPDGSSVWQATIPAGEEWAILPCDASGTVTVSTTGEYLSGTPTALAFNLDDSTNGRSQDKDFCLVNSGTSPLYPAQGEHYAETISAALDQETFSQLIQRENIYFSNQLVGTPANLALETGSRCNRLKIRASLSGMSSDWVDGNGCVTREGTITGSITFSATDRRNWQGSFTLPVTIRIARSQNGCFYDRIFDTENALHGAFVNYDNEYPNERTGENMKFSFKSPGHYRYISVVNNLLQPATITAEGDAPMECEMPSELEQGQAALVRCTATVEGEGDYAIIFTPEDSDEPIEKIVRVIVYPTPATAEARALYSQSPVGELAPNPSTATATAPAQPTTPQNPAPAQEEASPGLIRSITNTVGITQQPRALVSFTNDEPTARTPAVPQAIDANEEPPSRPQTPETEEQEPTEADPAILNCQKFFCDAQQTRAAYVAFLNNMRSYLETITRTQQSNTDFCDQASLGENGLLTKTIILQKVAADQSLDEFNTALRAAAQTAQIDRNYRNFFEGIPSGSVRGCGWYEVSATIDACKLAGSHAETNWRRETGIRVRVRKLFDCEQTLANAPLFLRGNTPQELGVNVGRRLVEWPQELGRLRTLPERFGNNLESIDLENNPASVLNILDLGAMSIGKYGGDADERDVQTAMTLYHYLYGQQEHYAAPAGYYEDDNFCRREGTKPLAYIYGAGAGVAIASCTAAALTGVTTQVCIQSAQGLLTAATTCVGMYAAESLTAPEGGATCHAINDCITTGLFGALSTIVPTGGQVALGRGLLATAGGRITTRAAQEMTRTRALASLGVMTAIAGGTTAAVNLMAPGASETTSATIPLFATSVYASRLGGAATQAGQTGVAGTTATGTLTNQELTVFLTENGIHPQSRLASQVRTLIRSGSTPQQAVQAAQTEFLPTLVTQEAAYLQRLQQAQLDSVASARGLSAGVITPTSAPELTSLARARVLETQYTPSFLQRTLGANTVTEYATARAATLRTGLPYPAQTGVARISFWHGNSPLITTNSFEAVGSRTGVNLLESVTSRQAVIPQSLQQRLAPAAIPAEGAAAATQGGRLSRARNALSRSQAGRIALQVLPLLLFSADVRPARIELNPALPSHFMAYHLDGRANDYTPTALELCVKDAQGRCLASESFKLADACNSDYAACLYQTSVTSTASSAGRGYNLIIAVNNPSLNTDEFFKSVFAPDSPPLADARLKGGVLSAAEITRLQNQRTDTGSGRGIDGTIRSQRSED